MAVQFSMFHFNLSLLWNTEVIHDCLPFCAAVKLLVRCLGVSWCFPGCNLYVTTIQDWFLVVLHKGLSLRIPASRGRMSSYLVFAQGSPFLFASCFTFFFNKFFFL